MCFPGSLTLPSQTMRTIRPNCVILRLEPNMYCPGTAKRLMIWGWGVVEVHFHIFYIVLFVLYIFLWFLWYKISRVMGGGRLRRPRLINYQFYIKQIIKIYRKTYKKCKNIKKYTKNGRGGVYWLHLGVKTNNCLKQKKDWATL